MGRPRVMRTLSLPSFLPAWLSPSLPIRMRRLAALLLLPAAATAAPETFVLDPEHSFVHFELLHFGTATLRGRLGPIRGEVEFDRSARRGALALRIPLASLDTGLKVLDARLREPDLLATEAYPEAFFVARQFRFESERLAEVRGEFTLRGVSQPLSLEALRFSCRQDTTSAPAVEVCGGDFEGFVQRSSFGATFGLPFVADRVRLLVQVEGRRR